jgi:hypothetical protein
LRNRRSDIGLHFRCCGAPAGLRTSIRGLRHFYHLKARDCTSGPESPQYLAMKAILAKAAIDAGWDVDLECRGTAPDGTEWIADVLARKKGVTAVAEIQMSPQTPDKYKARQRVYDMSGIHRVCWFTARRVGEGYRSAFEYDVPGVAVADAHDNYFVNIAEDATTSTKWRKELKETEPSSLREINVMLLSNFARELFDGEWTVGHGTDTEIGSTILIPLPTQCNKCS